MVQAGVSKEVIRAYIDGSPIPYRLSAEELIALKAKGVPDDLALPMVRRGAELKAQASSEQAGQAPSTAAAAQATPAAPLMPLGLNPGRGSLDPESYDYFTYYYLYPRTLAYANARLYSLGPPRYGYGYGGPGYGFGGYGFGGYGFGGPGYWRH
jgi:hypothetical protein